MRRQAVLIVIVGSLAGCSKAPSCSDQSALRLLSENGNANLDRIVTISASDRSGISKCRAENQSIMHHHPLEYRVLRLPDGNVMVDEGAA